VSCLIRSQSSRLPVWVKVLAFLLGKVARQTRTSSFLSEVLAGFVGKRVSTIPTLLWEIVRGAHSFKSKRNAECRAHDAENVSASPLVASEYRAEPA
jgi:hypothetical protein